MAQQQSMEELAKSVKLRPETTKKMVEYLKHDLLISLYKHKPDDKRYSPERQDFNVELNNLIVKTYEEWYGSKFNKDLLSKSKELPLFLMGPPGQGKTASFTAAAKEVCAALNLNLVPEVSDDYIPQKEDFILVVQECAGENSAITFGGIPKAEEITDVNGNKKTVLKKAINYRFTVFDDCAGGILLFDDAANAPSVIQNVLLPVAQFKTFQGLSLKNSSVLIGFTGNLGALDGTYTTEPSSALLTRTLPFFVSDDLKDFMNRSYQYYNDELGDMGYVNFLLRNNKDFAHLPDPGQKTGFPCSRSHDNLIQAIRLAVLRNGGRGVGESKALDDIHALAISTLGIEVGLKVVGYYDSYMKGADPLAKQSVVNGNFDKA
ncbi:MAG: hypothetical protein C0448_16020, partial [Sphingobacteriaceae bacterium]|nr:hypothetical protein [Sphingobacteriaceae bacterium]